MRFTQDIFHPEASGLDAATLCARMSPGRWTVEAGITPPPAHRPPLLLGKDASRVSMAVSLSTTTALRWQLGASLIDRIAADGCAVGPLAGLALHEVLLNAAIHGNLAVGSGPSSAWSDLADRAAMIAVALDDPRLAARIVTVAVAWGQDGAVAVVADEGDCPWTPSTADAGAEGRRGAGRGLMIARAAARVEILCDGRRTRLAFPCHATPPVA
jgi:hypothetical protein